MDWFRYNVLVDLNSSKRTILIFFDYQSNELVGFCILKNSVSERKICTLLIVPEYRGYFLGELLFEFSFSILGTRHPVFSVSSLSLSKFIGFASKYDWTTPKVVRNCYLEGIDEYIFNIGYHLQTDFS